MQRILALLFALVLLILVTVWWSRSGDAPVSTAPSEPLATAPTNTAPSADGSGNTTAPSGVTVPALTVDDLPDGPLRNDLLALPEATRASVLRRLVELGIPAHDFDSLRVTTTGAFFYVCALPPSLDAAALPESTPAPEAVRALDAAPVPITSPPVFHSRPGATRVAYLDFNGHVVSGTAWNTQFEEPEFTTIPYDSDGDFTTFSAAEQAVIAEVWARVAEDFAPFDVDVTTEAPTSFTATTARLLITAKLDSAGRVNPHADVAGGVAFLDVFGQTGYAEYSPTFVYHDNLVSAANIAEAASHELGHNLSLFHDGSRTSAYYGGHGAGDTSWAPIMGVGYGRNVTQWSKGEYYDASNTQDDLLAISARLPLRPDDHAESAVQATVLHSADGHLAASGVIERATDIDTFSFSAGSGELTINASPFRAASDTHGSNLDTKLELYNAVHELLAESNPASTTTAHLSATVAAGTYYLQVSSSSTGLPLSSPPSGYTAYGSIGTYRISGEIPAPGGLPPEILTHPLPGFATIGDQINFRVIATGSEPLTFQWRRDGIAITGATTATYTFTASSLDEAGDYDVVVSNAYGSVTSSAARLQLALQPQLPAITTQPVGQTVSAGTAVSFSVTASGTAPLSYQWTHDGIAISGETRSVLELASASPAHAGNYSVRITNPAGSVLSQSAALIVFTPPAFTRQPGGTSVPAGGSAAFTIVVEANPAATLQWQHSTDGGVTWTNLVDGFGVSGSQSTTLTLTSVNTFDSGRRFRCVATNTVGTTNSAAAQLLVGNFPAVVEIAAGSSATFFRKADGTVWAVGVNHGGQFGNGSITNVPVSQPVQIATEVVAIAAGSTHTLILKADGTLWGAGQNTYGVLGSGTVLHHTEFIPLADHVVSIAASAYLTAFITEDGKLWMMGGNHYGELGDGTTISRNTPRNIASGVKAVSFFSTHTAFLTTSGDLYVCGRNNVGQLGDGTAVDRATPVRIASNVRQITTSASATHFVKEDDTLWAAGFNSSGVFGNGSAMASYPPTQIATGVRRIVAGGVHTLRLDLAGQLTGSGQNVYGQLGAGFTSEREIALPITTDPITFAAGSSRSFWVDANGDTWAAGDNFFGQLGDGSTVNQSTPVRIFQGQTAPAQTVETTAASDGLSSDSIRLIWRAVPGALRYEVWRHTSDNLAAATLVATIENITAWDDPAVSVGTTYYYWLRAVGAGGSGAFSASNSGFVVPPNTPPAFTTHPAAASARVTESVAFAAVVTGSPAPTLQWQISQDGGSVWTDLVDDGTIFGSATGNLRINPVDASWVGSSIRCVATNSAGTTPSQAATLTVDTTRFPPVILLQPKPLSVVEGGGGTLTVDASGIGSITYQWRRNGQAIVGATLPNYLLQSATFDDAGNYDVVVSNDEGSVTSVPVVVDVSARNFLEPSAESLSARAFAVTFTVNTTGSWKVDSKPSWVTYITATSGTGTTQVSANVSANDGDGPRTGNIVINGHTFTITQKGPDSLDVWDWSNPLPSGVEISNVVYGERQFLAFSDVIQSSSDGVAWTTLGPNPGIKDAVWDGRRWIGVGITVGNRVYASADGATWTSIILQSLVEEIAWNGSVYVTVAQGGRILSSTDAVNWTIRDSGTTRRLYCVEWAGGTFIATGDGGTLLTSPDGTTWTARASGITSRIEGVVFDGTRWIVGSTQAYEVLVSTDLQTWERHRLPQLFGIRDIVQWQDRLVAVAQNGTIATSTDAVTWRLIEPTWSSVVIGLAGLYSIATDGVNLATAGRDGLLWHSADTEDWTPTNTIATEVLRDVVWNGSQFLAVGDIGTVLTSPDGVTWTAHDSGVAESFMCLLWDGFRYLAGTGKDGKLFTSADGLAWREIAGAVDIEAFDLAWNGQLYVAVGAPGASKVVYVSPDGENWSTRPVNNSHRVVSVIWNGQRFVAAGGNAEIFSSEDGEIWTKRAELGHAAVSDIAWNGERFVAVGAFLIATSLDGIAWEIAQLSVRGSLITILWDGTRFVGMGRGGETQTSEDGLNWVWRQTLPSQGINAIAQRGTTIVGVGSSGSILRISNRSYTRAPVISAHPQSQRVKLQDSVVLTVNAAATPAPTYQWRHNGTPLPFATNFFYQVSSIDESRAGSYDVVVTNRAGSVTSQVALITLPNALDAWRTANFSADELLYDSISGFTADPDHDGLANLAEYVLGTSPREASPPPWYDIGSTGSTWLYSFATVAAHPGANVMVEYSTDLKTWSETGIDLQPGETVDGMTYWNATLPRSNRDRVFFRLRITES